MRGPLVLALAVAALSACRHHTLTPTIGGRRATSLKAEAQKTDGGWTITLPMPLGAWVPRAVGEDQPMEVIQVEGRAAARWKVRPERWAQSERPFTFRLEGADGLALDLSISYTLFGQGTQTVLHALAHGWIPVYQGR